MAILIDEAYWPWRDLNWCHMVSDTSVAELREFGKRLGVPDRAFQGDHIDLPEHLRAMAIAAGARVVSTREILAALYAAGLRERPKHRGRRATPTHQP